MHKEVAAIFFTKLALNKFLYNTMDPTSSKVELKSTIDA